MHLTIATFITLFAAALSAPTKVTARSDMWARQVSFTEFATYAETGCATGKRIGTQVLTTSTECQNFSGSIVAGKVDINIPIGCSSECLMKLSTRKYLLIHFSSILRWSGLQLHQLSLRSRSQEPEAPQLFRARPW
jgi:hypothetical protein